MRPVGDGLALEKYQSREINGSLPFRFLRERLHTKDGRWLRPEHCPYDLGRLRRAGRTLQDP